MTVADLVAKLNTIPHDTIVVVRGYEDGVNEADRIMECRIAPFSQGSDWFYGSFEISQGDGREAVFISSTRDNEKGDLDAL